MKFTERKINLQLFAKNPDSDPDPDPEPEPKKTETKKPEPKNIDNSLSEKLDKVISLLTPKVVDDKEVLEVPIPKKPKLNPEEEKKVEEQKEESSWKKFWDAIWR